MSGGKPIPSQHPPHRSPSLSLSLSGGGIVNQIKILSCTNDILPKHWNNKGWENHDLILYTWSCRENSPRCLLRSYISISCTKCWNNCMCGSLRICVLIGQHDLHTISTSETGPKLVTKMSVLTSVTGPAAQAEVAALIQMKTSTFVQKC